VLPYLKERYINYLGQPSYEDKEGNEYNLASFGWKNEKTELLVVHTAGDVWIDSVQIQYIDREIQNRMPKDKPK
jgi:hypothetical protein